MRIITHVLHPSLSYDNAWVVTILPKINLIKLWCISKSWTFSPNTARCLSFQLEGLLLESLYSPKRVGFSSRKIGISTRENEPLKKQATTLQILSCFASLDLIRCSATSEAVFIVSVSAIRLGKLGSLWTRAVKNEANMFQFLCCHNFFEKNVVFGAMLRNALIFRDIIDPASKSEFISSLRYSDRTAAFASLCQDFCTCQF